MTMDTEPAIAKFIVEGTAKISGEESEIEKLLTAYSQTNVPFVFTRIYQTVYSVIFMLAGTVDIPYPSPALLKRPHVRAAYSATAEMPSQFEPRNHSVTFTIPHTRVNRAVVMVNSRAAEFEAPQVEPVEDWR